MFVILFCTALAQEDGGKKLRNRRHNPIIKTRMGFSPVLGLYKSNLHHTSGTKPKMAFNFSLKEEIRLDRHNQNFLLLGVEYMFHGVNFNSYYFHEDSLQLYTPDRLKYKYSITVHELNFPIQIKHSFQNETNNSSGNKDNNLAQHVVNFTSPAQSMLASKMDGLSADFRNVAARMLSIQLPIRSSASRFLICET